MSAEFDAKVDAEPGVYAIQVEGHLDDSWSEWFGDLAMELLDNGQTLLSGPIPDQVALHGLLAKIRDLGLTLLSVNLMPPATDGASPSSRRSSVPASSPTAGGHAASAPR